MDDVRRNREELERDQVRAETRRDRRGADPRLDPEVDPRLRLLLDQQVEVEAREGAPTTSPFETDITRVRQARSEYIEEAVAPEGTHFHCLVVTYTRNYLEEKPAVVGMEGRVSLMLNPALIGKYTEHSLIGTSLKDIVRNALKFAPSGQDQYAVFRIVQVENGMCESPKGPVNILG